MSQDFELIQRGVDKLKRGEMPNQRELAAMKRAEKAFRKIEARLK